MASSHPPSPATPHPSPSRLPSRLRPSRTLLALLAACTAVAACSGTTSSDVEVAGRPANTTMTGTVSTLALPPTAPSTAPPPPTRTCLDSLSPSEKVGQLILVLTSDPAKVAQFATAGTIGGVGVLDNQGPGIADSIKTATASTRLPLIVGSDEEGGTVQRLRNVLGRLPAARDLAKEQTPQTAETMWKAYAQQMKALGFTLDFGPVLDVGYAVAIKSRSFSTDPQVAATYGLAVLGGLNSGGITPVVKHWPGLGSGDADPHGQRTLVPEKESLSAIDWVPFRAAIKAGVPAIMTTHAEIPDVTGELPVTVSPEAMAILRGELGFDGVAFTDSLIMAAISLRWSQPEAAEMAIAATHDVVLVSGAENAEPTHARLLDAVTSGRLPAARVDEAVERVLRLKGITGPCPSLAPAQPDATAAPEGGTSVPERDPTGTTPDSQAFARDIDAGA